MKASEPANCGCRPGRTMLDAMFYRARTGCLWEQPPERFGPRKGLYFRYRTWRTCGVWDQVMAALPNSGQPVWVPNLAPALRIEGRVEPASFPRKKRYPWKWVCLGL
ncbi:transposase [Streptomyces sp. NPDC001220]